MKTSVATTLVALALTTAAALSQDSPVDRVVPWPPGAGRGGSISADGRWIAYVDRTTRELNVWDTKTGTARQITGLVAEGGEILSQSISWDGRWVAFGSRIKGQGQALRLAPVDGTEPAASRIVIKGSPIEPREWSRDGTRLLVTVESGNMLDIGVVDIESGELRVLKSVRPSWLRFATLSPDGAFVAYDVRSDETDRRRSIFLVSTDGSRETPLLTTPNWNSVVGFAPDGKSVVVLSDRSGSIDLWRLPIANGQRSGEPVLLKSGFDGMPRGVTAQGGVLYERPNGPPAAKIFTVAIDDDGRATSPAKQYSSHDSRAFHRYPRWSSDGSAFMYLTSRVTGPMLSIRAAANESVRETPLALTSLLTFAVSTFDWSPDRRSIVFRRGGTGFSVVDVDAGAVRNVATSSPVFHPQFTRDGRAITYFRSAEQKDDSARQPTPSGARWSYAERDLASGVERVIVDLTEFMRGRYPAGRSPDGRFLLAMVYTTAPTALFAYDMTTSETREVFRVNQPMALNHYGDLRWMPDSRTIVGTLRTATLDDHELWWIPVDGRPAKRIDVGVSPIGETGIAIHPNGREIAFVAGYPIAATMPLMRGAHHVGADVECRVLERFAR